MTTPSTTFALLRQHGACEDGYRKLARHLGGVTQYGRDKPIPLTVILDSNGLDDTLWSLRATLKPWDRDARLYAADCAERVLPIFEKQRPSDDRPREAIEAARAFARGEIDAAAWDAARDAARDAADAAAWNAAGAAAGAAAWNAAGAAVWNAARNAAVAAAWNAAGAAARDAAWNAAVAAARDAEQEWQRERLHEYLSGNVRPIKL